MGEKNTPKLEHGAQTTEIIEMALSTTAALPSPTTDAVIESKDNSKDCLEIASVSPINSKKRVLSETAKENEPSSKKSRESPPPSSPINGESKAPSFSSPPGHPATSVDKESWQGFCDIESEPAYFSVILREMGVQGATVREVFAMDPALLEMLPQPIHGLILLFHYREFAKEDQAATCPPNVWFANQLPAQSSCATLAMINILMNSANVDVGEHLKQFKHFTHDFTPYQRGEALASFNFVKRIHNSFAKKMDILESDKHLSYKVAKAERLKRQEIDKKNLKKGSSGSKSRPRRPSADSTATDDSAQSYEENAHHYIAFVPVGNEVWKLDGLDAQPTSMGTFDTAKNETWLSAVSDTIATLMAAGDDDYGVVALTESPLLSLRKQACSVLSTIAYIESRLSSLDSTWRSFLTSDTDTPPTPICLGIQPRSVQTTAPCLPPSDQIDKELLPALLDRRTHLIKDLNHLANSIIPEIQAEADEDQKAAQRRYDTGPVIKKWLEMLAENGHLEQNLERFMPASAAHGGSGGGKRKAREK